MQWVVESPLLWGELPAGAGLWRALPELSRAEFEALAAHRRVPIGRYFERLVQTWLGAQPEVSKLHANITIQGATRTLGELDLVFEAHGAPVHWELAVKFYLGVGELGLASSWHGPRARDRLDKKLGTMLGRQLGLPQTPEARARLTELGLAEPTSHALIKGYLFHPFDSWLDAGTVMPPGVPAQHLRGWWLRFRDCEQLLETHFGEFRVLEKCDWLAPWLGPGNLPRKSLRPALAAELSNGPLMVATLDASGLEVSRGFVVPDAWSPL